MFQGFFVQCIGFWIILIMVFLDCLGDDGDSVLYKFPVRVSSKLKYRLHKTKKKEEGIKYYGVREHVIETHVNSKREHVWCGLVVVPVH